MNTQLENSIAIVKARQAVIAAQKSLADAEREAKQLRVQQAMQPLWAFITPLLDQPSQHYRHHRERETIRLRQHLDRGPIGGGAISFYDGCGNTGLTVWFNADHNSHFRHFGNYVGKPISPEEALQAVVDHVARVLITNS